MTEKDSYPCFVYRPGELPKHPVYERKNIRAIFKPRDNDVEASGGEFAVNMTDELRQMVGHEFVWKFIGFFGKEPLWLPADLEDIAAYYEIRDRKRPKWKALWILEADLDIIQVEKLDG